MQQEEGQVRDQNGPATRCRPGTPSGSDSLPTPAGPDTRAERTQAYLPPMETRPASSEECARRIRELQRWEREIREMDRAIAASADTIRQIENPLSHRDAWGQQPVAPSSMAEHHHRRAAPTPPDYVTYAERTTPRGQYGMHEAAHRIPPPGPGHSTLLDGGGALPLGYAQPGYVPVAPFIMNTGVGNETYPGQYGATTLSESQRMARIGGSRDLPHFSGAIEEWPLFIGMYNQSTAACGFSDAENVMRLQHALKGVARETVGHLLSFPHGLGEAMSMLEKRFGRSELLVEHMIDRIKKMPAPRIEKLETIVEFGYAVRRLVAAARASGVPGYAYDVTLLKELVRKVPPVLCIDWARHKKTLREVTLVQFGNWCGELADDLCSVVDGPAISVEKAPERADRSKPTGWHRYKPHAENDRRPGHGAPWAKAHNQAHMTRSEPPKTADSAGRPKCVMCSGNCPSLASCGRFVETTVAARRAIIRSNDLCEGCLGFHRNHCGMTKACGIDGCGTTHHTLLHDDVDTSSDPPEEWMSAHRTNQGQALLKYVPVVLYGPKGSAETYAFLDDGSTSTFMDHALMHELGLTGTPNPLCVQWTGNVTREEKESVRLSVRVAGRHKSSSMHELADVHTVRELALPAQTVCMSEKAEMYSHLRGLPIASYRNAVPRILIGVNNCRLGQALRSVEGRRDEPIASKTRLGWVIGGPCSTRPYSASPHMAFHACACDHSADDQLVEAVKEHFAIESLGVQHPARTTQSVEDERALMLLERHTKLSDGRYETGLLWRSDDVRLPSNKASALRRYECLKRKLMKDPALAEAFAAKMNEYVTKGYIRRLSRGETAQKLKNDWYLPVFLVTNPNKPGKIRMVFDAAAKVGGVSLNSHLLAGPDLLAGLLSVMFKFREHRVGFAGDIREMFHQVSMRKEDQRSQMILWDGDEPGADPAVYAVTVMTFGAACSPTSAQYVKNRNADRFAEHHPRAVACIKEEHYVDDLLASVETDEEAIELAETVRHIHGQGGFDIRNWVSNSKVVASKLRDGPVDSAVNMNHGSSTEKVLGMWWDTSSDKFTFRLSPKLQEALIGGRKPVTKRELLRIQMSVYDPMGLLGHFVMYIKVLLQEIWRGGYGWDQQVDDRMTEKWETWLGVLPGVEKVTVPRCYRQLCTIWATAELHVFCDASENGMAAVAYLRFDEGETIECSLVGGKTRVAPLKFVSIPRLELQAAVIGTRLAATIRRSHRIRINRVVYWTDSRNVLSWLHSDHRRYNQFVAFRVGEILETTEAESWRWVPSKLNVADDGTKWTKAPDLSPDARWFRGPCFLWGPETGWPAQERPTHTTEDLRPNASHHRVVEPVIQFAHFSKWKRLTRAVAYAQRFVTNARCKAKTEIRRAGPLTQEELAWAERTVIKEMQREAYRKEIDSLRKNQKKHPWQKGVEKGSSLYKLSPELDSHGVLRVGGRLAEDTGMAESQRKPIILPRNHYGTNLLIHEYHEQHKHCCHNTAINAIRSRYHVPRLRAEFRRARARCQKCKVACAKPQPPLMGVIPYQRIAVGQPAFSFTGVDYLGPFFVGVGRRVEKRWGVIFTCLTTRAVHLETAHSLTTASCILAIRRFIARRGTPREILSDCGTNFVGASRELENAARELDANALMEEFTGPDTKWTFNPPGAPHFGGCWERLVQSVKKVLGGFDLPRRPTDEVFTSTLTEIEQILNSRPLTYIALDDEMDGPITPNHLLLGSSDGSKPPVIFCDEPTAVRSAWKAAQRNADWFWQKWVAEYLPTLTRRSKWFDPVPPIKVGDLVVIVDNNLPRNCWPKGRVASVVRAKDGQVRQATVRTVNGTYVRPVHKLAVLDVARN